MDFEVVYAYLLGVYLGDGHVTRMPRTWRFTIALDAAYPDIVSECVAAIDTVVTDRRVALRRDPKARKVDVVSYWKRWPLVFPQAGPGYKHSRPIVLEPWQREIVDREPEAFLRGLIHSDGCR